MTRPLFSLNPDLDRAAFAAEFARNSRVQIRDVLTKEAAETLRGILERQTQWGFAYYGTGGTPVMLRRQELLAKTNEERREIAASIHAAAAASAYAVRFNQYPLVAAYLGSWAPGGPHDLVLEHINDQPFLDLVRAVTAIPELIKADAQATLYGPGDFLSLHTDSHVREGWRVAYVLNLANPDWSPDWGGYLNFLDEDGDIVAGWKPRFNALNLFLVPQRHSVSYVPPFAPAGRFALTGWFRDC